MIDFDSEFPVIVSDDESCSEITQVKNGNRNNDSQERKRKNKLPLSKNIETIILDDENLCSSQLKQDYQPESSNYKDVRKENKLFAEFVETCLNLQNSEGMSKIVNDVLLKNFWAMDQYYRKSAKFDKVLNKALICLAVDPDNKFSHIRSLSDTIKFHKQKKRVQLTTLATNLKDKVNLKRTSNFFPITVKRKKINSIAIDSDEDIPVINLDEDDSEALAPREQNQLTDDEKENNRNSLLENIPIEIESSQENNLLEPLEVEHDPNNSNELIDSPGSNTSKSSNDSKECSVESKIRMLEGTIAFYKAKVKVLEEAEVDNDTVESPYIICEKFKEKIVLLYKQLCQLVGEQPVKTKSVKLQVSEGHPSGPVRRLEKFLNELAKKDGDIMFPDFSDVVKCVLVANKEDALGWNKTQVMAQANALFTQCGRALQKRRQRKEYKDLIAMVHDEEPQDPADDDPVLLAKLEENRRLAEKKEIALLKKFTALQNLPPKPMACPNAECSQDLTKQIEKQSNGTAESLSNFARKENKANTSKVLKSVQCSDTVENQVIIISGDDTTIMNEGPSKNIDNESNENTLEVIKSIQNTNTVDNHVLNISNQSVHIAPAELLLNSIENESNENTFKTVNNFPSDTVNDHVENISNKNVDFTSECKNNKNVFAKTKIKKEPIDIVRLLDELGDNFTTSVFDIEDPFLVTVISDSSDSDD